METITLEDENPIAGYDDPIKIEINKRDQRAVIIHPILGGDHKVAQYFSKRFARKGWTTIIQHRARLPYEYDRIEDIAACFDNIQKNAVQVFNYLQKHDIIKADKTIVLGTSFGAVGTAMSSLEINAAGFICIMGGAYISQILTHSESGSISTWREQYSKDDFSQQVNKIDAMGVDPYFETPKVNGGKLLLFNTLFDKVIPTRNQRYLLHAFEPRPKTKWYPVTHYGMALCLPFIKRKILKWANRQVS